MRVDPTASPVSGARVSARLGFVVAALLTSCAVSDVSRSVGARCDSRAECDDRCLAPASVYPDGFCTLSCDGDDDCPDDTRCTEDEGGVCLFQCRIADDCAFLGVGWGCIESDKRGVADTKVFVCRGS